MQEKKNKTNNNNNRNDINNNSYTEAVLFSWKFLALKLTKSEVAPTKLLTFTVEVKNLQHVKNNKMKYKIIL